LTLDPLGLNVDGRKCCIDRAVYLSIIRGERRGVLATIVRGGLRAASWPFRAGVAIRGSLYAMGLLGSHEAPIPVISIGNLTAGGTGKTPLTIALAQRLVAQGEKPAVLARGYGAARDGELNEELELVKRRVPQARVIAGRDRVASAAKAATDGATVVLLDDGFQHRRLARALDVLVIDATDPWGQGFLLPRGLLREPVTEAKRADAIVLSRVEQAGRAQVDEIKHRLQTVSDAPIAELRFAPSSLTTLKGESRPLSQLQGANVVLLSAIGNPRAFEETVRSLGAKIALSITHPDHHHFSPEDVTHALRAARETGSLVLTTEKDAVKIQPQDGILALGVEARLEEADELLARVDAALHATKHPAPGRAPLELLAGGAQ
jgi:tetraacyldisaccharide 4'-kinase